MFNDNKTYTQMNQKQLYSSNKENKNNTNRNNNNDNKKRKRNNDDNVNPRDIHQYNVRVKNPIAALSQSADITSNTTTILVSNENIHYHDILLGRGGRNNQHHGNELLRQIARQYAVSYSTSSKSNKTDITKRILHQVHYNWYPKARFLKKLEDDNWEEVNDMIAREKIGQVLRDAVSFLENQFPTTNAQHENEEDGRIEDQQENITTPTITNVNADNRNMTHHNMNYQSQQYTDATAHQYTDATAPTIENRHDDNDPYYNYYPSTNYQQMYDPSQSQYTTTTPPPYSYSTPPYGYYPYDYSVPRNYYDHYESIPLPSLVTPYPHQYYHQEQSYHRYSQDDYESKPSSYPLDTTNQSLLPTTDGRQEYTTSDYVGSNTTIPQETGTTPSTRASWHPYYSPYHYHQQSSQSVTSSPHHNTDASSYNYMEGTASGHNNDLNDEEYRPNTRSHRRSTNNNVLIDMPILYETLNDELKSTTSLRSTTTRSTERLSSQVPERTINQKQNENNIAIATVAKTPKRTHRRTRKLNQKSKSHHRIQKQLSTTSSNHSDTATSIIDDNDISVSSSTTTSKLSVPLTLSWEQQHHSDNNHNSISSNLLQQELVQSPSSFCLIEKNNK